MGTPNIASKPQTSVVSFETLPHGFQRYLYFNRFSIEPAENGRLVILGFLSTRGFQHQHGLMVMDGVKADNANRLLPFAERVEVELPKLDLGWVPDYRDPRLAIETPTIFHAGYHNDVAEIATYGFSYTALPSLAKSKKNNPTDPLSVFRCSVGMMKLFINELFS